MTDDDNGDYSADFVMNRDGYITVSVVLARKGGLYAEYFNNAFLSGEPTVADRVDNVMKFDWGYDLLTPTSGDFVSIHWYGKILSPATEDFTFILSGDDGFKMYLDGVLLIDRWNWCCDDMAVTVPLIEGTFYDLVLEYKELQNLASFNFEWYSPSVLRQTVPPTNLYYSQRINNLVYQVEVVKGPSIPA